MAVDMDEMLILVLEQAAEVIGEKASDEQSVIENLIEAKSRLEKLEVEKKGSLDPIKDFLARKIEEVQAQTIFKDEISESGELALSFDRVQELYRLGLVLQWLYDEAFLRDLPHEQ